MLPFNSPNALIGMVHLQALPGTPRSTHSITEIIDQALNDAHIYATAGMDGIMIENMHDVPYLNQAVGPEVTAVMTAVATAMRKEIDLPMGIQVLAGANQEALAIALAAELQWIRAEGFVFGHVSDEGYIDAQAGKLLRYRKQIGADHIQVWTDIKKKHSSHALTADVDIVETGRAAEFFCSDALIVTGVSTGTTADVGELDQVKAGVDLPVVIGSGITVDNVHQYFPQADACIVGSSLKKDGKWNQPVDKERVTQLVEEVKRLGRGA